MEFLLKFNFVISYQSGKKNDKADALTQKPEDRLTDKKNEWQKHRMQVLLPSERFQQAVELQPIEENENKKKDQPSTKTLNSVT